MQCVSPSPLQREDLSDYEMTKRLKEFKEKFGYTQTEIAKKLGKSEAWVSLMLSMLKTEEIFIRVKNKKPDSSVELGEVLSRIDEGHARVLLNKPEPIQEVLVEEIVKNVKEDEKPPSIRKLENGSQRFTITLCYF